MTARGFYTLLFGALMLFTALSVGSAGAFLLGTAALLCWALSLLCVCAAALSCRALACAGYHRQDDFARVLLMAAPRLRTAGSAAVFSTRLTPAIADAAIALSRMGARMRYTLVTAEAPSEEQGKLLDLLRVSGLEALHVRA